MMGNTWDKSTRSTVAALLKRRLKAKAEWVETTLFDMDKEISKIDILNAIDDWRKDLDDLKDKIMRMKS